MQNDLDPKGLEAAVARLDELAGMRNIPSVLTRSGREFIADKTIRTYLSAVPDGEGELVERRTVVGTTLNFFASVIKSGEPWTATCQAEFDKAHAALAASRLSQAGVRVKPLEWSSEPPYSVARVTALRLFYSTEAVWEDGAFQYVELRGGFASGDFPTVAEAKAAAQADYEARIRSALGDTL